MSNGLTFEARQIIFAHKSRIGRLEERNAVLEAERDTARAIAVELEQQTAAIEHRLDDLKDLYASKYCQDPSEVNADALRVVQELDAAINHITSTVMRDLCDDARETP